MELCLRPVGVPELDGTPRRALQVLTSVNARRHGTEAIFILRIRQVRCAWGTSPWPMLRVGTQRGHLRRAWHCSPFMAVELLAVLEQTTHHNGQQQPQAFDKGAHT